MNDTLHKGLFRRWEKRRKDTLFAFPDPLTEEAAPYDCKMMKQLCHEPDPFPGSYEHRSLEAQMPDPSAPEEIRRWKKEAGVSLS